MGGVTKLIQGVINAVNEEKSKAHANNDELNGEKSSAKNDSKLFFENLKWLTSREAVDYLRLPSVGALRQLVYRRRIPYAKIGHLLRFNRRELDRFLESSTRPKRRSA